MEPGSRRIVPVDVAWGQLIWVAIVARPSPPGHIAELIGNALDATIGPRCDRAIAMPNRGGAWCDQLIHASVMKKLHTGARRC